MLHHVVMWKLHEGEEKAQQLAEAVRLLRSCSDIVPGIVRFDVACAQPGFEASYDLLLNSTFSDRSALEAYQAHPQHVAIKPFMKSVVAARQCMDYGD
jgi:quinol monooxygenase YgiN